VCGPKTTLNRSETRLITRIRRFKEKKIRKETRSETLPVQRHGGGYIYIYFVFIFFVESMIMLNILNLAEWLVMVSMTPRLSFRLRV
jgi:hypothetical protein